MKIAEQPFSGQRHPEDQHHPEDQRHPENKHQGQVYRHHQIYRKEGGTWLVEIRLNRLDQLFNNLDPAPFWHRDLDDDAAKYILDSVQELPARAPVKLIVHLDTQQPQQIEQSVRATLCSYFLYRAHTNRQRLYKELKRGRISLLVGLAFLSICFGISHFLQEIDSMGSSIIREGLLIMGWVAMWRPLQIFLYDWWPHLGRAHLYERVANLPLEVRALHAAPDAAAIAPQGEHQREPAQNPHARMPSL